MLAGHGTGLGVTKSRGRESGKERRPAHCGQSDGIAITKTGSGPQRNVPNSEVETPRIPATVCRTALGTKPKCALESTDTSFTAF